MGKKSKKSPKYVDVLDEDKPIAGQKYACISFLSPEKIIQDRNTYNFNEYVKQWDLSKSIEKFNQFMGFIAYKYNISSEDLTADLEEFCKEERDKLFTTTLFDEFKTFMDINETRLEEEYNKQNDFQTSVRGIKIRGVYPTQGEAELRCKMLREVDPNHDVYVGPVGLWMPFHPEAYKTGRVEYLEEELNKLMHEKNKNEQKAKIEFDKRVKETKAAAIEENEKKANESGNLLTQSIDEKGNLVNHTRSLDEMNLTPDEMMKSMCDDETVVTDMKSDRGLSAILENA